MSLPKFERNRAIVKLRKKDPKKWSYAILAKEFGLKSKATVHAIYTTFVHKI